MRFLKKYKAFWNLKNFNYILPVSRILKFKRTKWKRLQAKLLLTVKSKDRRLAKFSSKKKAAVRRRYKYQYRAKFSIRAQNFKNRLKKNFLFKTNFKKILVKYPNNIYPYLSATSRSGNALRHFCRSSLFLKRSIFFLFNQKLSIKYFKKSLKKKIINRQELLIELLIKPFFQLEILLWKLGFFKSTVEIRQLLLKESILINNNPAGLNTWLTQGDIITFKNISLKNIVTVPNFLWSIVEVDYFTNTIVVLLNYTDYNTVNLPLLLPEVVNLGMFVDYIKNK